MSDTNDDDLHDQNKNDDNKTQSADADMINKIVQDRIQEELKDIKSKLDKAYGSRDDALRKVAEFEQKEKEAELRRLHDEGKYKEAHEIQLAEEKAKREVVEKRNIELTRDIDVKSALGAYTFRNENALGMAFNEVVNQLVRNEQGIWTHRSGISIKDFVKTYVDDENNSFLLKPKPSSGSGSSESKRTDTSSEDSGSLLSLSNEEILKRVREGRLPKRN